MKRYRIRTTPGIDQNITLKLEQTYDALDILSLEISQQDLYNQHCSDRGVVVGRVSANGFGMANAKISVFIPLSDEDATDTLISTLYPYTNPNDTNAAGIRYNLLPKTKQNNNHTPVGTFFSIEEILSSDTKNKIFEKYYKLTTISNGSGDFMLFGVPTGVQTIHVDLDLSDTNLIIRPQDFQKAGYPAGLFESKSTYKASTSLDTLPQIFTLNKTVSVIPLFGSEQCEVGISRLDFDFNFTPSPSAVLFGGAFTHFAGGIDRADSCKFSGIYGYTQGEVEVLIMQDDGSPSGTMYEDFTLTSNKGNWVVFLPMTENRMITDEIGNIIPSPDDRGIPTKGSYRFIFKFKDEKNNSYVKGRLAVPSFTTSGCDSSSEFQEFEYDIYNHRTRFYTVGQEIFTDFTDGLKLLSTGRKGYNFPPYNKIDSPHNSFGGGDTFYGSLYFPQLANTDNHCDDVAIWEGDYLNYRRRGDSNSSCSRGWYKTLVLDVTDILSNLPETSHGKPHEKFDAGDRESRYYFFGLYPGHTVLSDVKKL